MENLKTLPIVNTENLKPQEFISPSSINTYYMCPREYYWNYIAKVKEPQNIHLIKGSIVHSVLEEYFKEYRENMDIVNLSFNRFKALYNNDLLKACPDIDLLNTHLTDALNTLQMFFIDFNRRIDNLILIKKAENRVHAWYLLRPRFRELLVSDSNLHCKGIIDRVQEDLDGGIILFDYKTSTKYGYGLPEEYKRQLGIYALLYYLQEKTKPKYICVHFLRYGEQYFLEVNQEVLDRAKMDINYVYGKTRSVDINDYPPLLTPFCRFCSLH